MDWVDLAIVAAGLAVVGWLLHAASVIGSNPGLRVRIHEDLAGGRLPENLSAEEKQALLDLRGLAPRSAGRAVIKIVIVAAGAAILMWMRR